MYLLGSNQNGSNNFSAKTRCAENRLIHHAMIHVPGHDFSAGQMTVFCLIIKEDISPIGPQKLRLISAPKEIRRL